MTPACPTQDLRPAPGAPGAPGSPHLGAQFLPGHGMDINSGHPTIRPIDTRRATGSNSAFTLIELLVVISIIALLIGILLPALAAARESARAIACASNSRSQALAMASYGSEYKEFFPPSYVYPTHAWNGNTRTTNEWVLQQQFGSNPANGYLHWSFFLFNGGTTSEESFQCPTMENGGLPATNPHPDAQVDGQNTTAGSGNIDRQARWMAYTANEAIIPRNKFFATQRGEERDNRLVRAGEVANASDTVMVTEFLDNWVAVSTAGGGGGSGVVKSHRSINPFVHNTGSAGSPTTWTNFDTLGVGFQPSFGPRYPIAEDIRGNLAYKTVISSSAGGQIETHPLRAVGGHHPSIDDEQGGTANFTFADGHVERTTLRETIEDRRWGDEFYGLTGGSTVADELDNGSYY